MQVCQVGVPGAAGAGSGPSVCGQSLRGAGGCAVARAHLHFPAHQLAAASGAPLVFDRAALLLLAYPVIFHAAWKAKRAGNILFYSNYNT